MAHNHPQGSEQQKGPEGKLSIQDKLFKMVEFWLHHNEEHARSYREWAGKAREIGLEEVGFILETLAREAVLSNHHLERLMHLLKARPASH
jgi:hypothetical protein